jgi:hypothetical protein
MSENKHTPGPWSVCAGDASWVSLPGVVKPINCGNKANARLIAAAPDMLAALQDCAAVVAVHAPWHDLLLARTHAAITKATRAQS